MDAKHTLNIRMSRRGPSSAPNAVCIMLLRDVDLFHNAVSRDTVPARFRTARPFRLVAAAQ